MDGEERGMNRCERCGGAIDINNMIIDDGRTYWGIASPYCLPRPQTPKHGLICPHMSAYVLYKGW